MLLNIKLVILPDRVETTIAAILAAANKMEAIFMYVALVITISLAFDWGFFLFPGFFLIFPLFLKRVKKLEILINLKNNQHLKKILPLSFLHE